MLIACMYWWLPHVVKTLSNRLRISGVFVTWAFLPYSNKPKAVSQKTSVLTHRLGFCYVGGDQRYFSPNARWASFTICLMRCSSDFGQMRSTSPASATI